MIAQEDLIQVYEAACRLDVEAFKPGNVSVYSEGHGMTVRDFLDSAEASALWISNPFLSLGEKVYFSVKATRETVGCNTNLGILLLTAPLFEAVQRNLTGTLRARLRQVLQSSTQADAAWVYKAIRLANPGGLGQVSDHDVASEPTVPLLKAMEVAKGRDRIAYNYCSYYKDVYETGITSYHNKVYRGVDERWVVVFVYLGFLKRIPDSHVERKFGKVHTPMIAGKCTQLETILLHAANPDDAMPHLWKLDQELKAADINPGTTADLTVATLVAVRLEKLLTQEANG